MKKEIFFLFIVVLIISGCGKKGEEIIIQENISENETTPLPVINVSNTTNHTTEPELNITKNATVIVNQSTNVSNTIISNKTTVKKEDLSKETLQINPDIFPNYFRWYKCRGSCRLYCQQNDLGFLQEDIDEGDSCVCRCSDKVSLKINNFEDISISVISKTETSVNVKYVATLKLETEEYIAR